MIIILALFTTLHTTTRKTNEIPMTEREFETLADGCGDDIECEFDQLEGDT